MSPATAPAAARRRAPRLYWRIYLHGVGLLILVALALSVSAWLFDPQPISTRLPRVLAAALRDQPEGEALAAEVRRLAGEARVAVALYRDDGRLLGSGGADAPPPLAPADVARLRRTGDPIVHVHRLIAVPAGNDRYLAMALSRGFVEPVVKHILLALLVVVAVLGVGSLPLARTVARPIERLSETARRLGAGELSVRSNDNAAKYSEADAPVTVAAARDGEHVAIDVGDRGIGIDPEDLPRLFTPFFRTDRSRSRGTGGVDLGLALAKRIVEAHGGTIVVTSRPGEGTTVRLRLPPPRSEGRVNP